MKRVVVAEEAVVDLEEARAFYEHLEPGVGEYCVDALLADVSRLGLFYGFHARHFGCLRALGTRFPFGIYYLDESEEVRVIAILDLRRNPSWLRSELRRRDA